MVRIVKRKGVKAKRDRMVEREGKDGGEGREEWLRMGGELSGEGGWKKQLERKSARVLKVICFAMRSHFTRTRHRPDKLHTLTSKAFHLSCTGRYCPNRS